MSRESLQLLVALQRIEYFSGARFASARSHAFILCETSGVLSIPDRGKGISCHLDILSARCIIIAVMTIGAYLNMASSRCLSLLLCTPLLDDSVYTLPRHRAHPLVE